MELVYFNEPYANEFFGVDGCLVNIDTYTRTTWEAVADAMLAGEHIHLRHATPAEATWLVANIAILKANQQTLPM